MRQERRRPYVQGSRNRGRRRRARERQARDRHIVGALWSGYGLIVWGGELLVRTPPGTVGASDFWPSVDGAIFTPASS